MLNAKQVIFSGVGQSEITRRESRSAIDLTLDAALEAIAHAGLDSSEIDGLSSYPGVRKDISPGFGPVLRRPCSLEEHPLGPDALFRDRLPRFCYVGRLSLQFRL